MKGVARALARACSAVRAGLTGLVGLTALVLLASCAAPPQATDTAEPAAAERLVIVAVADGAQARPAAGATARASYRLGAGYAGSDAAQALAQDVAQAYTLTEVSAWTIDPLRLRCMLFRLAPGTDRAAVLQQLAQDPRVQLAQPLNQFDTYAQPAPPPPPPPTAPAAATTPAPPTAHYNDPYLSLQLGFARIGAAAAQRHSKGQGVRVAVIDTEIDTDHPELAQRAQSRRDFVAAVPPSAAERHGTEVAGVIFAAENNHIGIAGVAPAARLLAYRACWALPAPAGGARCDSFSLAQALSQSITDQADVINLSLGGPPDPLLQRLVQAAQQRGSLVVGALPPSGRAEGFPTGVPGVLVAAMAEQAAAPSGALPAPGRDVLTLGRGAGYGLATGSSLAAAHVTGAVALLRALQPRLDASAVWALLVPSERSVGASIDLCQALRRLRPGLACAAPGP